MQKMPTSMPISSDPVNLVAQNVAAQFSLDINLDGPIRLKELTRQATREVERNIIFKVLQAHRWNRKKAARALGVSYRGLLYKIKEAGL